MQVRRAHSTGQALVTIVTGTADFPGGEAFARRLMARCPDVRGVTQSINDRDTSAVMGFRSRVLAGRDEIWDELGGLKVCLTARSFSQINTVQAEKLYQRAIDLAQLTPGDRVLDAYCGVGLIGMLAARRAGREPVTRLPWPGRDSARMLPPWPSAMRRHRGRPRPKPWGRGSMSPS